MDARHVRAAQHLHNGPQHFGVLLDSVEAVLGAQPHWARLQAAMEQEGFTGMGVAARYDGPEPSALILRSNREARAFGGATAAGSQATTQAPEDAPDLEVRFFFTRGDGVGEDPITGSFNAGLAQWLIAEGHAPTRYLAAQGSCIGRAGRVHIEQDASGQVWVGGDVRSCIDGVVTL